MLEGVAPTRQISKQLSPLFVLYDLRVAYSHLASDEGAKETLKTVTDRLGLDESAGLYPIYDRLVHELSSSFEQLTEIVNDITAADDGSL